MRPDIPKWFRRTSWALVICVGALPCLGDINASATADAVRIRNALNAEPPSDYRIYSLCIGTTSSAKRNLFILDPSLPRRIQVAFSIWLIRGKERVILVDTGFLNRGMVDEWKIEGFRPPDEALLEIGIRADQITDVVITHTHWDHIGGLSRFPAARIWLTRTALDNLGGRHGGRLPKAFLRAKNEGRLRLTDSVQSVAPSVVVVPVGLHTPGFQYVVIRRTDGLWVLASDIAPLWANFERKKASGQSPQKPTLAVQVAILDLVDGDLKRIIPGHEPGLYKGARVVEVTARPQQEPQPP